MPSSTVSIISLGEIVHQNQLKALQTFAKLVGQKNPAINQDNPKAAFMLIHGILGAAKEQLEHFKNGSLTEADYTNSMIAEIQEKTGVLLTVEEFDTAWNTMNPRYDDFAIFLEEAIRLKAQGNEIIFISNTNPKDMSSFIKQLKQNNVSCEVSDGGELMSIGQIPVFLSYVRKQSKADLITDVIRWQSPPRADSNTFWRANNPSHVYAPKNLQYIRGVNMPTDPLLKLLDEATRLAVDAAVKEGHVKTIIWDRFKGETLSATIQSSVAYSVAVSNL